MLFKILFSCGAPTIVKNFHVAASSCPSKATKK